MVHQATLSTLPRDLLDRVLDYATGFDLLALSCVNSSLHQDMELDQSVWSKRLGASADKPVNGTWKQAYAAASSLRITNDGRQSAIPLPNDLASRWQTEAFSVDMWFCLLPPSKENATAHTGGVLLGAQSTLCTDEEDTRPRFHQQLIHVDSNANLYCSVSTNKMIVKAKLQQHRWYHVALTYSHRLQCVYLDGAPLKVGKEPLHVEWSKIKGLQFGSGFMTYGSKGRPSEDFVGWLGFNGLVDDHRVWDRALSMGEIQQLSRRERLESPVGPTWSSENAESPKPARHQLVRCTRPLERHFVSAACH